MAQVRETIVIDHLFRELSQLPTPRARLRVFSYVMDRLREEAVSDTTPAPPPVPEKQVNVPLEVPDPMDFANGAS